jgi:hypothetical protein
MASVSFVQLGAYALGVLFLSVVVNLVGQLLPRKKSEPPTVFHWLPFVGNAISYGMDPLKFYMECRKKVCTSLFRPSTTRLKQANRFGTTYSTVISSLLFSSVAE